MEEENRDKKERPPEEKRGRRKLDIAKTGPKMLMCTGILCGAAIILYLIGLRAAAYCTAGAGALVFAALLILLKIESRQGETSDETSGKAEEGAGGKEQRKNE